MGILWCVFVPTWVPFVTWLVTPFLLLSSLSLPHHSAAPAALLFICFNCRKLKKAPKIIIIILFEASQPSEECQSRDSKSYLNYAQLEE